MTDDSTDRDQHCATSSGPGSPAAWTPKLSASTSRTPASIGSIPRRVQASSQKDTPGTTSSWIDESDCRSSTVRSATDGDPGTAYATRPCSKAAVAHDLGDRSVNLFERRALEVAVIERDDVAE